jgi:hypothetical protein
MLNFNIKIQLLVSFPAHRLERVPVRTVFPSRGVPKQVVR